MTLDEVKAAVEHIRATARDDEHAHNQEDVLYLRLLKAAAAGEDIRERAALAIATQDIDFERWSA